MSVLLEVDGLTKTFPNGVRAVDGVSFTIDAGETVGVVGESGCGKSTTAKLILRLLRPDAGRIAFDGRSLTRIGGSKLREVRRRLQVVPQNPMTSLNPRLTVGQTMEFNLRAHGWRREARRARIDELLERVGLRPAHADRYPHQLSGGQSQRVAIARALATKPDLLICDEAVSALDKSIQAQVLNLLAEVQRDLGVACLFISHDLSVVEHIADRTIVMYQGRIVERGATGEVWSSARHPYTRALLSAVPGRARNRIVLEGDPPDPAAPPAGCAFRSRCWLAHDACASGPPPLVEVGGDHQVACIHETALAAAV